MVSDYELGLKVSKEYFMNCITYDKELVYSEGYLCKVGKDTNVDDRLELYYKYAEKTEKWNEALKGMADKSAIVSKLQNDEMELMKKRVVLESEIRNL
jgi:methyl coenzyme M reductase subunit D